MSMNKNQIQLTLSAFFIAALFAIGLLLAGMTHPQKIRGFLDFTGHWDPSLMFVMASAIPVYFFGFRWIQKKGHPILESKFHLPILKDVTFDLVFGSALFGIGWGLAGYCPGPAFVNLGTLSRDNIIFVITMLLGMYLGRRYQAIRAKK